MQWYQAAFLGLIQGLTEFLPVSSSGHLALMQIVFGLTDSGESDMLLNVLLHLGTLIAIFVAFWSDIKDMVVQFFSFFGDVFKKQHSGRISPARRLILLIIVATLPLLLALPLKSFVEKLYVMPALIGCALIVTGILLFISDRVRKGNKTEKNATMLNALYVGIFQALAIVPGFSRSGFTITGGIFSGFKRDFAVKFSFLLSIPAVLGATLLELFDAVKEGVDLSLIPVYLLGVAVAVVSGYLAIRLVRYIANRGKFGGFAYYCALAGAAIIIFSFFNKGL